MRGRGREVEPKCKGKEGLRDTVSYLCCVPKGANLSFVTET
jgi:hypothetical protein